MMRALILATLMLLLTACASGPAVRTETEIRYPPQALTAPCPVPVYNGETWGDVAQYAVQVREVALACNADKTQLREWAQQQE